MEYTVGHKLSVVISLLISINSTCMYNYFFSLRNKDQRRNTPSKRSLTILQISINVYAMKSLFSLSNFSRK